jgi:hypothetical protein
MAPQATTSEKNIVNLLYFAGVYCGAYYLAGNLKIVAMFSLIFNLLPLTLYMWIGYGPIYRSHNSFTKRWPSMAQMRHALARPEINTIRKGIIRRFMYLTIGWYVALSVAALTLCYLLYAFTA